MVEEALAELLRRAQSGDRGAQGDIVRRYESRVRAAIHGRLGHDLRSRVDTEDVLQSAVLASLADLRCVQFEGEERFVHWLVQVARRRLVDAARAHRCGSRDVAQERPIDAAADAAACVTSPSDGAIRDETSHDVRRVIAGLPQPDRQVVELRAYEGLGFLEIARRAGLPDRHAARHVFQRALLAMSSRLEDPDAA